MTAPGQRATPSPGASIFVFVAVIISLTLGLLLSSPSSGPIGRQVAEFRDPSAVGLYASNFTVPRAEDSSYLVAVLVTVDLLTPGYPACNLFNFAGGPTTSCTLWVNGSGFADGPAAPVPSTENRPITGLPYGTSEWKLTFWSDGGEYTLSVQCIGFAVSGGGHIRTNETFNLGADVLLLTQAPGSW